MPKLITAYYAEAPDPSAPEQRVKFGTSGHRGSAFDKSFNEWHILAITQAICLYRERQKIDGPLFLGMDRMPFQCPLLPAPWKLWREMAWKSCSRRRKNILRRPQFLTRFSLTTAGVRQGSRTALWITPSHNPPRDGGFKYNPPNGGPGSAVTAWIEAKANEFLEKGLLGLKRISFEKALRAPTT